MGVQPLYAATSTFAPKISDRRCVYDPQIRLLLNYVADPFAQGSGPSRYALLAKEEITSFEKEQRFKDLNVQIIPISKAHSYSEVTEFLQAFAGVK